MSELAGTDGGLVIAWEYLWSVGCENETRRC